MKVLFVDLETAWRGGQNQALLILRGLRARGHSVELVSARGSALGQRAQEAGVRVHFVSRGFFRLAAAKRIHNLVMSGNFDLVHANEAHAVSAVWLAKTHERIPYVISRRVGYPIGKSRLARARYEAAARIIANSKWVATQAAESGAPRSKLTVIHEGTEIPPLFTPEQRRAARASWGIDESTPLLGCVGVLLPDKGQEWLIRALAEVKRSFPHAKLLLAGDGPCQKKLEVLAKKLRLTGTVLFPGFVKDVARVYAALDVFLLPSFFEALNNSLLAAMAYEVPPIAFARGALGEIVEDGKSGVLVSGPNVAEISEAIVKLLRDADLRVRLGQAGREEVIAKFSSDRMVANTVEVYEEVLIRRTEN